MKPIFITSLISTMVSYFALFGFLAMSLISGSGIERERDVVIAAAVAFAFAWLGVAFWARPRRNAAHQPLPPQWLRRLLVGIGAIYVLGVLVLLVG